MDVPPRGSIVRSGAELSVGIRRLRRAVRAERQWFGGYIAGAITMVVALALLGLLR
jgi:hypothetical protein